jgi:phosphoglycolate phosphatase-like HAD superfamily hydrolase
LTKNKIFFDFDGPINDVSRRHYAIHKILLKKLNIKNSVNFQKYWGLKQSKKDFFFLKKKNLTYKKKYRRLWIDIIEKKKFLQLDKLHIYSKNTLRILKNKNYLLYLITLRSNKKNLLAQIKRYKIKNFFKRIILAKKNRKVGFSKYHAIKKNNFSLSGSIIIGDTEEDIVAGKLLKIPSVAVLNGIRSKKLIGSFKPNYIIKNINQIQKKIKKFYD